MGVFVHSISTGELAQMVERSLSMREVPGSIPGFSTQDFFLFFLYTYIIIIMCIP